MTPSGQSAVGGTSFRPLSDLEFRKFQGLFHERIGLHLAPQKKLMLSGRLGKRLDALGMRNFAEYLSRISDRGDPEEFQTAVDLITTHETFFFREVHHFDLIREEILPSRTADRPLRVWSAACSTGEEPYSIAMVLHAALGATGWEVLASDIGRGTLEKAERGLYRMDRIDGIPESYLRSYCLKGKGENEGTMLVSREIRSRVGFRQVNLTAIPGGLGLFDIVFLRNVIIYFDAATKREVLAGVCSHLAPGGWLLLGHSESIAGLDLPLELRAPTVYRKVS